MAWTQYRCGVTCVMAADEEAVGSSYFQSIGVSLGSEAKCVVTNNQLQLEPGDRTVFVVGEGVNVEVRCQPLTSCVYTQTGSSTISSYLYTMCFYAVYWFIYGQDFSHEWQTLQLLS